MYVGVCVCNRSASRVNRHEKNIHSAIVRLNFLHRTRIVIVIVIVIVRCHAHVHKRSSRGENDDEWPSNRTKIDSTLS